MFSLPPLFLWCLIFWLPLEAKDIAWQCPRLSRGSLPVPGMVGERSHTATGPELGDLLLITAFTALQRLCIVGALYATEHYFSLIAALSKIAWDHLRQWEQKLRLSRLESCVLTDHAFQNETPVYEIRLK